MRLAALLGLPATLIASVLAVTSSEYSEHLHLKPLPNGYLYAGFNFTSSSPLSAYENQRFRYFPRALAQILQFTKTEELHLRFALGRWDEESWGARPRDGSREGGTGVELWAWLDTDGGTQSVSERWTGLVNSLSGLFCASLNFIDSTKTIKPVTIFDPEGTRSRLSSRAQLLHGALPHEVVCTENLTPFMKLLPCKGKAGISSLLDGHKVFDANWQTMSIDVYPVCAGDECVLEVQQTVDIVMDIERSMRPRDDPIPRPKPIEEIECDTSKHYNSDDTCYPSRSDAEMAWSLSKIFGTPVRGSCHLADSQHKFDITLEVAEDRNVNLTTATQVASSGRNSIRRLRLPDGNENSDLSLSQQSVSGSVSREDPPLFASRQITGYGAERGGMLTVLRNPYPYAQAIIYLESLPWFLRPYMHTLAITVLETGKLIKPEKMHYTPALDRERGTHLELLLTIPASSTVELAYDFEKAILRYTKYPPDANRGFDVAPAVIRVLPNAEQAGAGGQGKYLRTTSLLLPLPTPDFSMPYNVIILTSTVIALGFGSIFNLLVRRFVLAEEVPPSPVAAKLRPVVQRIKDKIKGARHGAITKTEMAALPMNGAAKANSAKAA